MYFEYDEQARLTRICIEQETDVCAKCAIREKCTLLLGIITNIVYPSAEQLTMGKCSFYKEKRKKRRSREPKDEGGNKTS